MSKYFHVVIEKDKKEVLFNDLSKRELKKSFSKPFKKGKDILVQGTIHKIQEIRKVQIIKTEKNAKKVLEDYEKKQNKSRDEMNSQHDGVVMVGPYFLRQTDIVHCGEDVTSNFLYKAPSNSPSLISR